MLTVWECLERSGAVRVQAHVMAMKTIIKRRVFAGQLEAGAHFLHRTIVPRLTGALLLRLRRHGHIRVALIAGQWRVLGFDHTAPSQRAPGGGRDGGEEA